MRKIIFLLCLTLDLSLCLPSILAAEQKTEWGEAVATLTAEELDDGDWAFTIEYEVPESTAYNIEGEKIAGPIKQFGLKDKKILSPQKVKIRYMKDEPSIFEYQDKPFIFESI
jgi:hypothetical protein